MQVLPRLDGADEQDEGTLEAVSPANPVAAFGLLRRHPDAQRHHAEPSGFDAGVLACRLGREGGTHHQTRVATRELQPATEDLARVPGVVLRVGEEREVVDGGNEWSFRRRHDVPRVVHDVDATGQPLDARGPEPLPGLVQDLAGEGEPTDGDGRNESGGGPPAVPRRNADEVQPAASGQRVQQLDRRDGDPTGHDVPGLFDRDRDAHAGRASGHDRMRRSGGARLVL
jgi:hypothetical protein